MKYKAQYRLEIGVMASSMGQAEQQALKIQCELEKIGEVSLHSIAVVNDEEEIVTR